VVSMGDFSMPKTTLVPASVLSALIVVALLLSSAWAHGLTSPSGRGRCDPIEQLAAIAPGRVPLASAIDAAVFESGMDRAALAPRLSAIVAAHADYSAAYRTRVEAPIQALLDAAADIPFEARRWDRLYALLAARRNEYALALAAATELDRALASRLGSVLGSADVGDAITIRLASQRILEALGVGVAEARLVGGLPDLAGMLDTVASAADTPATDRAVLASLARAERVRSVGELGSLPPVAVAAFLRDLEATAGLMAGVDAHILATSPDDFCATEARDALVPRLRAAALRHFDACRRTVESCRAQTSAPTARAVTNAWLDAVWGANADPMDFETAEPPTRALGYQLARAVAAMRRDPAITPAERRTIEETFKAASIEIEELGWKRAGNALDWIHDELAAKPMAVETVVPPDDFDETQPAQPMEAARKQMRPDARERSARVTKIVVETLGDRATRYLDESGAVDELSEDGSSSGDAPPLLQEPLDLSFLEPEAEALPFIPSTYDEDWIGPAKSEREAREEAQPRAPDYVPSFAAQRARTMGLQQLQIASLAAGVSLTRECARAARDAAMQSKAGEAYRAALEEFAARAKALPSKTEDRAKVDYGPVFIASRALDAAAVALDRAIGDELVAQCAVPPDSGVRALILFLREDLEHGYSFLLPRLRALPLARADREVLFTVANAELERLAEGEAGYRAAMMRADAARAGYAVQDIGLVKASRLRSTDREEFERMRALICARQDAVMKALARAATVAFGEDDVRTLRVKTGLVSMGGMWEWSDGVRSVLRQLERAKSHVRAVPELAARWMALERGVWRALLASEVRQRSDLCGCAWTELPEALGRGWTSLLHGPAEQDLYRGTCAIVDAEDSVARLGIELAQLVSDAARAP